jgi:IPT/TIG domain
MGTLVALTVTIVRPFHRQQESAVGMMKPCTAAVCATLCLGLFGAAPPASAQVPHIISVPAGGNLQTAIDAAVPGDTIQLQPGVTYKGTFVLPAKAGTAVITIRTAPDSRQPGDGVRVQPAHAPALAKLTSGSSMPALRTAGAAHHYTLMLLEFGANSQGSGDIVQLGQADSTQTSLAQVPYSLVLDRLYVHGDPLVGQKRGIALNSASTQIINCYISDIKAVAQDAQAIAAMNGPGPYVIENNYLEAAAENFLAGGVDPMIANLTPSDITFRYNHLYKPSAWRNAIVPTPARITATVGAGTLPAGTYAYRVVAQRAGTVAGGATALSAASAEVTVTLAAPGSIALSWPSVESGASYRVYGRLPANETQYWKTTTTSFVDTGAAGTSGKPGSGTVWTVKNLFELKNARRVLVERNVMQNNWQAAQAGYAIVFTPRNSGGLCTWCAVEDVTFRLNIVRHTAAGVNILGYDNTAPSGQAHGISVIDNLFYDVSQTAWGGNGLAVQMGDGPADVTFDHNTIDHFGSSAFYAYGSQQMIGVQITNNLMRHGTYGIFGAGTTSYGTATINQYFPGGIVTGNVLAGGTASKYPAGNLFPTVATHVAQFTAPASGDYSLVAGSLYAHAALDGKDLGANISEIVTSSALALGGAPPTQPPVTITTTQLPQGVVGMPYQTTLSASGGDGQYTWSLSGALPGGVSFNAANATLSGVPNVYGSWPIQVTAADSAFPGNTATQALTLVVSPAPAPAIGAISPASASAGASALTLTVTGTNFNSSSVVQWNGSPRPTTFVSSTQLTAAIGSPDLAAAGSFQVTVLNPAPGGGTSAPAAFTVTAVVGPSLTVSATTVAPGASVTVTLTNGAGGAYDWLSFAAVGAPDNSFVTFVYVGAGVTTRTWTVTAPTTAGSYEFRLYPNNGYTRTATSPSVTVQSAVGAGPVLTVSATSVSPGASITVTLTGGYGGMFDWLAFAATTAPASLYLDWTFVGNGVTTRTWTVTAPATPGTYEFRLFPNNSYTLAAKSPTITVQ